MNSEKLSSEQKIQEVQYLFPYHYVPKIEGENFSQCKNFEWGYEYLSYINFILEKIKEVGFFSLLDVGCGDGRLLHEIHNLYKEKKLAGIDYSPKAIDFAKVFNDGPSFIVGDITNQSLFDEKFDIITLVETLEHIPPKDIRDFIKGINFHLKDGGVFILTVPSKNKSLNSKHYQHFNRNTLESYLSEFFNVTEWHYLNRTNDSMKVRIIRKILTNRFFILNQPGLLKIIYKYYINNLFKGNDNNTGRICVVANKKLFN